jgi:hypothetical protein
LRFEVRFPVIVISNNIAIILIILLPCHLAGEGRQSMVNTVLKACDVFAFKTTDLVVVIDFNAEHGHVIIVLAPLYPAESVVKEQNICWALEIMRDKLTIPGVALVWNPRRIIK